ncbi:hypothetical protein [Roseisolibacter sp. H3M3-2]|uniref:hypothetical protein n=1 Tax=Roseisolibacter sp. H3M3-2 TaxID=3031323 RepID=UPI0023DBE24B|nr:hypothetical protein [Roseisolibacter sp. H3M3-2]MDF1505928.1 hypothetical protein [Roseisolibacter sp. H3M3-2]
MRHYRRTVVGCALLWFLVGLHAPTLHELLDHGWRAPASVVAMTALLAALGVAAVWALLRAPARPR